MKRNRPKPDIRHSPQITLGFIDSTSVHSAMGTLIVGTKRQWTPWEQQSLLEVTYLLMHPNMRIIPVSGTWLGASGPITHVLETYPSLHMEPFDQSLRTQREAKNWANRNPMRLRKALAAIQCTPNSASWVESQIEQFWTYHVKMYGALFNRDFIQPIAKTLDCSPDDLERVHSLSSELKNVLRWRDQKGEDEAAQLAKRAWLVAALIRGKVHEKLAEGLGLQLVPHPFRQEVESRLKPEASKQVSLSEQIFTKMIIGSALEVHNETKRIKRWADNIRRAREGIEAKKVHLPNAIVASDAERHAADSAKAIDLPCTAPFMPRLLDYASSVSLGSLIYIALSPWPDWVGLASAVGAISLIQQGYKLRTGKSVGETLANTALSTNAQFSALGKAVPGRISRKLALPE